MSIKAIQRAKDLVQLLEFKIDNLKQANSVENFPIIADYRQKQEKILTMVQTYEFSLKLTVEHPNTKEIAQECLDQLSIYLDTIETGRKPVLKLVVNNTGDNDNEQ